MVKLWQNVDTLKLHLYSSHHLDGKDITTYNQLLDDLINTKHISQTSKNEKTSFKQYQHLFGDDSFQVMPSTVRGFSVSIKNQEVTIHLKKIVTTIDPNPFCKVEFRSSFLHRFGYLKAISKLMNFIKSFIIPSFKTKISEIHLHVDIQGYTFSVLDFHRIKARSRNNRLYDEKGNDSYYYQGRSFQGFMMGSGDYLLRVYNKSKEIKKMPNKSFIEELWKTNSNFDNSQDVFRIEFQIRREKLKNLVIDGEIMDGFEIILNNLNNIWGKMLHDFSLRNLSDKEATEIMLGYKIAKNGNQSPLSLEGVRTRFNRSDTHPLWELIKDFNGHHTNKGIETFTKPFTNDFIYVHNAFKAFLSTSLSHFGCLRPGTIIEAILQVEQYTKSKHDKTVLEDVLSKKLDRFNKLIIQDNVYENLEKDKEYFMRCLVNIVDDTYLEVYERGLDEGFIDRADRALKAVDFICETRQKMYEQRTGHVA